MGIQVVIIKMYKYIYRNKISQILGFKVNVKRCTSYY